MAAPLIFYSTNTWLAFQIAELYYKGKHYAWGSPFFHGQSDKGAAGFVAPTSTPWEIYRSLAGAISESQEEVIGSIVEGAAIRDFEPLVYVMPYGRVARLSREVPVKERAHPLSLESIIDSAPSRDDAVEATYLAERMISHRGLLERGLSRKGFLARYPESSPRSRRLALAIIEEITKRESAPLHLIPQEKLDRYSRGLSRAMWRRVNEELHLDAGQGRALLEEMRRTGEARLRPQTS